MKSSPLMLAVALAACQPPTDSDPPVPENSPAAPAPSSGPSAATAPPPQPSATATSPDRFEPPLLTPEAERGEKGARNVLLSWAAAMEAGDFASARALFRNQPDPTDYSGYREITVGFGDGDIEGGAGSLYYAVPVWLTATTATGAPARREGTITLRRVNDVPGSTAAQRRWGIERIEW